MITMHLREDILLPSERCLIIWEDIFLEKFHFEIKGAGKETITIGRFNEKDVLLKTLIKHLYKNEIEELQHNKPFENILRKMK